MTLQVGVKVLLKNTDGKYLLLKRNLDKYPEIKKEASWDIPGGRIDPELDLLENLKREVFEETAMQFNSQVQLIAAQDIILPDRHVVRLTYTALIHGEPMLSDEHVDFRWLTIDQLIDVEDLDPYVKEVLPKL